MLNEDVMERVLNWDNLQEAYKRVKANKGAAGVDRMKVEDFAEHARVHWPALAACSRAIFALQHLLIQIKI